jgi:hypothetical protein
MVRLASVVDQGDFPAPLEAVAGILRHPKVPDPPPILVSEARMSRSSTPVPVKPRPSCKSPRALASYRATSSPSS